MRNLFILISFILTTKIFASSIARQNGFRFAGTPTEKNSITDIPGIEVGMTSVIHGESKMAKPGQGPARTGVTIIFPLGKEKALTQVYAGWHAANGAGELTGSTWINESGFLNGPVAITSTTSVGVAHQGILKWFVNREQASEAITLPVVGETFDGFLNDIFAFHLKEKHVLSALDNAHNFVPEGNTGGGTGMICFEFKCGTGTSSRTVIVKNKSYKVGVLVQANFGRRHQLILNNTNVGRQLRDHLVWSKEKGSIIGIIATDAPLIDNQLRGLASRGTHGIARLGATSGNGSGDIFLAFSTANQLGEDAPDVRQVQTIANEDLDALFEATAESIEEAVVNSMVAAEEMYGMNNHYVSKLPIAKALEISKK